MNTSLRVLCSLSLALVACKPSAPATIETATFAPALGVNLAAMTRLPSGMYIRDLVEGSGASASAGQTLGMHYTGWLINGTPFDSNGTAQAPLTFQLGARQVIVGWDQGVAGMKVGGRRQLVIPPALGYGATGVGPIPANAILVFQVDLVSAN